VYKVVFEPPKVAEICAMDVLAYPAFKNFSVAISMSLSLIFGSFFFMSKPFSQTLPNQENRLSVPARPFFWRSAKSHRITGVVIKVLASAINTSIVKISFGRMPRS